jgi:hypothetical protein
MNSTTTVWLSSLTAFLAFLGIALGYIAKWVNANKDTIIKLVENFKDIKATVDRHGDAIGEIQSHPSLSVPAMNVVSLTSDSLPPSPAVDSMAAARSRVGQAMDPRDVAAAVIAAQGGKQ